MAAISPQLATAFSFAQIVLLFATAAYVYALRPPSAAKRLLALVLALRASSQLGDFLGQLGPAEQGAAYWFFVDMGHVYALGVVALAAVYPTRVRWRSLHGALLAFGLATFLFQALSLTLARDAFYRTAPGEAAFWIHIGGFGAVALSCVLRLPQLPPRERRGGSLVVFAASGGAIIATPGFDIALRVIEAAQGGVFLGPSAYPGPYGWLAPIVIALVVFVLLPALIVVWYRRERHPIVPLTVLYGLATVPLAYLAGLPYYFFTLIEAIVVLHLFARHEAMGVKRPPTRSATTLAIVASAAFFLAVVAVALANFGESALALAGGILAGLVCGGLALIGTLPRERLALRDAEEDTTRRLSAYGIALDRELRAGRSPEEAGAALAPLRAALRVSDDEHAALVSDRAPPATGGLLLGRYQPLRVLGEGGGGVTRLCRDERVGREVVLKTLRGDESIPERRAVLLREARAIGAIKHPHVITLHDVVDSGSEAVIVMEHAERGSLRDALRAGPLKPHEWRRVADGLLRALEAVHAAGVIHRDVKPSNVLLDAEGTPKLADFGIASVPGFETTVGGLRGGAVGTYRYMSPEQAKGRPATARSDLFSAAATLYEALTGAPYLAVVPGESAVEVQMRAAGRGAFDAPVPDPRLRGWFARALDPQPSARFATAAQMREALDAALG